MSDDTYEYQIKPLPPKAVIGSDQYNPARIGAVGTQADFSPVGGYDSGVQGPQQPSGNAGAGGGGTIIPPYNCSSTVSIGTLKSSVVAFPCDTPTSSISVAGVSLLLDTGEEIQLNTAGGYLQMTDSGSQMWLDLNYSNYVQADDNVVKLNELNVCHLGAPGFRKFLCGDAYA